MRVWIFGDSFGASTRPASWTQLLARQFKVENFASNGSSEHRIWKSYQSKKTQIMSTDKVIFVHTHPSRIFLKNDASLMSRTLASHPTCDLILSDIHSKGEAKYVEILKDIWDDEYFDDTFNLILKDLMSVPNSTHITFFDSSEIDSYFNVWQENKGTINHMNEAGNLQIFEKILECIN